ncbi:MAG: protein kinase [Gemmatimonas sp.]
MRQQQWDRVKSVFLAALDLPASERAEFVAQETRDDDALRDSVESLLQSHDAADDFMETPAATLSIDASSDPLPSGGRVGPYRLLREIGRGGMGTVYLAARDDGEFQHQVAVKLVKRGMDTDLILARFRHERQILAGLDHPNIARLLDGGTTDDGLPYFVMEFVDGTSIRDFSEARGLPVAERLALFQTVCAAVQHAHQNLIVHRDIKASNIVVTAAGVPKLLDFGIAKLLRPAHAESGTVVPETVHAMTPEYASPEQIRGDPVTTATDVYSLGVLLYELLSGQRPFSSRGRRPEDIARAVCETEPPAPSEAVNDPATSALRRRLRGDLDTIVLMAMRKDPRRRYTSVDHLSEDIGRYLAGHPVMAQRDTLAYRTTKFARRNRLKLAASVMLFASLVAGLVATTWQARVAGRERARAERRFAEVRTLATSFLFEVHDAIGNLPGATPARALLVKRGLASLDGLSRESQGDPALQRELAVAYQRVGDVQGNSYGSNLGDTEGALKSFRTSVDLLERVAHTDSMNPALQSELAVSYKGVAGMLNITGDLRAAIVHFERALAIQRRLVARYPANMEYRRALATLLLELGDSQGGVGIANVGNTDGALASYREAIALREMILVNEPQDVEVRAGLASTLLNLGSLALTLDDTTGAAQVRRGVSLLERIVAERPFDALRRNELLSGYARLRQPLLDAGRFEDAIVADRKTIAMLQTLVAADTQNTLFQRNLGVSFNYLGRDLRAAGRAPLAVESHRRALAITQRLSAADPQSTEHRRDVAFTQDVLAEALADAHEYSQAIAEYRGAIASKLALRVIEPSDPGHADDLAFLHAGLGAVQVAMRDYVNAEMSYRQAIPLAEAAVVRTQSTLKSRATLAVIYSGAGRLYARRSEEASGDRSRVLWCRDANAWYQKSADIWRAMRDSGALSALNADKHTEAIEAMSRCAAVLTRAP